MRKFNLNLLPSWGSSSTKDEKKLAKESAVIDGVDVGGGVGGGIGCGASKVFGIKSYLHHFYLASPNATLEDLEPGGANAWYLLPPPPAQRMGLYICRIFTIIGLLLLMGGAISIIIGYCWPLRSNNAGTIEASLLRIAIDQDEDGNFYIPPERFSEFLRDPMHTYKIVGFCVFAIGASLMALSLLVPTCAHCFGAGSRLAAFASEDNTPNEPPVRIYPAAGSKFRVVPTKLAGGHKISPTSVPVPVNEEIAKVQPNGKKSQANSPLTADQLLCISDNDNQPLLKQQY